LSRVLTLPRLGNWLRKNRGLLIFILCLGFFRTAIADWNPVPSGSMRPTILEGDVVLVNRLAYDFKIPLTHVALVRLGDPQRGDIVTFFSPKDGTRLIKRVVALPGDVVELRRDVLYIDGQAARYSDFRNSDERLRPGLEVEATRATERLDGSSRRVQFLHGIGARRSFGPAVVPPDCYFMLGDNRDDSEDSRYIGFVPRRLVIGRAGRILVSADITGNWLPRFSRTASRLE
jgi:signal peptidase I